MPGLQLSSYQSLSGEKEEKEREVPGVGFTRTTSLPQPPAIPAIPTDLPGQWQRLTSYIVSLEKEVQFYKQLVQDIQANQVNKEVNDGNTGHLAPAIAGMGGAASEMKSLGIRKGSRNEALLYVFSYLSVRELCCVSRVSREWQSVARHPSLWRRLVLSEIMLHPQVSPNDV